MRREIPAQPRPQGPLRRRERGCDSLAYARQAPAGAMRVCLCVPSVLSL